MADKFDENLRKTAFSGYGEYMEYLFACVNMALEEQIERMKIFFATEKGGYKNVLYPDLEVASEICSKNVHEFQYKEYEDEQNEWAGDSEAEFEGISDDLLELFGDFVKETSIDTDDTKNESMTAQSRMEYIASRAEKCIEQGIALPF